VGIVAIPVLLATATAASAQGGALYTGVLTGHVSTADGGDVREGGLTLGASVGVIDEGGLGVEVDLGHTREFDDLRFVESGITSLMVNFLGSHPGPRFQPFIVAGVGLLRVRTALALGEPVTSRTDWGFNGGGGLTYMFNDAVGVRGDVRYLRYFQRHDDLPLLDNGFFDYWRTSIGVTFAWPIK
jgi:opacity protein-like surface antigen